MGMSWDKHMEAALAEKLEQLGGYTVRCGWGLMFFLVGETFPHRSFNVIK